MYGTVYTYGHHLCNEPITFYRQKYGHIVAPHIFVCAIQNCVLYVRAFCTYKQCTHRVYSTECTEHKKTAYYCLLPVDIQYLKPRRHRTSAVSLTEFLGISCNLIRDIIIAVKCCSRARPLLTTPLYFRLAFLFQFFVDFLFSSVLSSL